MRGGGHCQGDDKGKRIAVFMELASKIMVGTTEILFMKGRFPSHQPLQRGPLLMVFKHGKEVPPFSLCEIITGIIDLIYSDQALIKGLKGQIEAFVENFKLRSLFFCRQFSFKPLL